MQIMNKEHPQWPEYYSMLAWMLKEGNGCTHDMNAAECGLESLGFTPEERLASLDYFRAHGADCSCEILMNLAGSDESGANTPEPSYVRLSDVDLFSAHSREIRQVAENDPAKAQSIIEQMMDPKRLEEAHYEEQAYRRGVSQALSLTGDLVRGGATADDLDQLTDLSMDWRYDRESHLAYLDELVQAWRQGERGVTGIDLRSLAGQPT